MVACNLSTLKKDEPRLMLEMMSALAKGLSGKHKFTFHCNNIACLIGNSYYFVSLVFNIVVYVDIFPINKAAANLKTQRKPLISEYEGKTSCFSFKSQF